MKFLVAVLLVVACTSAFLGREDEDMFKFMKFVKEHNREYQTFEEFHTRFEIFKSNLHKVDDHESFSPFMDMTETQFQSRLNLETSAIAASRSKMERYTLSTKMGDLPTSFDWRDTKGVVNNIKDQGQCGSCWAFSAVANLEGLYFKKNGKSITLSEQQLVDCDRNDGGCNGGWMDKAFEWVQQNGGIESDKDYAYHGRDESCRFDASKVALQITGFKDISQNEDEIARVLMENGPISVALNANPLQFYSKGIISKTARECSPRGLNHGVALVGFGEEAGKKFWVVRNSWGQRWGEQGYFRMERGQGTCGINTTASTATLN